MLEFKAEPSNHHQTGEIKQLREYMIFFTAEGRVHCIVHTRAYRFFFLSKTTKLVFGIFKIHVTTARSAEASNCSFKKIAVERV